MAYRNKEFCWHGIISTDVEAAKAFYSEVIGWEVMTTPMGDGVATMFAAGGIPRAHLSAPEVKGVPSHWDNYLRVEDVDASTRAAKAKGGDVVVPPMDIPPGRFSVVKSPSGAMMSLFHEADPKSENAPAGPGAIHWVELHSQDIQADLTWLRATLGFETQEMPMPSGPYFILGDGETGRAGAMQAEQKGPAFWLAWVQVDDVDETLKRVKNHGGEVLSPLMDVPNIGRMAVVADSTGGTFGVITPPARG